MPNRGPEDYLEMAQNAEKAAHEAQSDIAKRSGVAIASEYRELAAEKLNRMQQRGSTQGPAHSPPSIPAERQGPGIRGQS